MNIIDIHNKNSINPTKIPLLRPKEYLILFLKSFTPLNILDNLINITIDSIIIIDSDSFKTIEKQSHIFEYKWLVFSLEESENKLLTSLDIILNSPIPIENSNCLDYLELIEKEYYNENIHKHRIANNLLEILLYKLSYQVPKESSPEISIEDKFLKFRKNLYEKPYIQRNVDSSAEELSTSRSQFQHQYKKFFNVSFIEDFINARINYAKKLLLDTDITVKDIAVKCGYKTFAHFDRQFKKTTSLSPLEFRQREL